MILFLLSIYCSNQEKVKIESQNNNEIIEDEVENKDKDIKNESLQINKNNILGIWKSNIDLDKVSLNIKSNSTFDLDLNQGEGFLFVEGIYRINNDKLYLEILNCKNCTKKVKFEWPIITLVLKDKNTLLITSDVIYFMDGSKLSLCAPYKNYKLIQHK